MKKEFTEKDMLDAFNTGYDLGYKNANLPFVILLEQNKRKGDMEFHPYWDLLREKRKKI